MQPPSSCSLFGLFALLASSGCIFLYEPADQESGGAAPGGFGQGGFVSSVGGGGMGGGGASVGGGGMGGGECLFFPAPGGCEAPVLPMFPNVESLSGSANGTYLGPVAIGRDDVFFTLGTEVWRYIKAAPMPMTTQVGTLPQVIGDLEVVGGDVFVSSQGKVMWRCSDMACAPLAADDVGSWNKLARIPNASNAPLFALHNPEATLYRLTTEGVPTATLHSVGANWAGYDVDALDEQNLAFTAWGAGGDPNTGVVYRSFMPAVGQQTWSPQAMHAGAIALRGDKTIFVMVGDAVSERLFEWGPGDGTAKLSPLDAKLGAVPVASPLKYNAETDVLYAVGVKDSGYTLAACRCGTCAMSDVVCSRIGGIDVERNPCDPHHGAAYFTCDDKLIRWDYPAPP